MKQTTFASLAFERKKKQTRRERFLSEMEKVVPWTALLAVIEPHYPTTGRRGRPLMPLATMLQSYFMQQWYALSDPAMEDEAIGGNRGQTTITVFHELPIMTTEWIKHP